MGMCEVRKAVDESLGNCEEGARAHESAGMVWYGIRTGPLPAPLTTFSRAASLRLLPAHVAT